MAELRSPRFTHREMATMMRPLELDLEVAYKALQAEVLEALQDGMEQGMTPDQIIASIDGIIDEDQGEDQVQKELHVRLLHEIAANTRKLVTMRQAYYAPVEKGKILPENTIAQWKTGWWKKVQMKPAEWEKIGPPGMAPGDLPINDPNSPHYDPGATVLGEDGEEVDAQPQAAGQKPPPAPKPEPEPEPEQSTRPEEYADPGPNWKALQEMSDKDAMIAWASAEPKEMENAFDVMTRYVQQNSEEELLGSEALMQVVNMTPKAKMLLADSLGVLSDASIEAAAKLKESLSFADKDEPTTKGKLVTAEQALKSIRKAHK